jgi:hypothetical protein
MRFKLLVLTLAFVTISGCMLVREDKVKPPVPWPPQLTQEKKTIGISVAGVPNPKGANQLPRAETIEVARSQALRAYTESGLFSSVVVSDEPTDFRADIAVVEDGSEGMGASGYISALSFTMIPGYVSEQIIVKTSLSSRNKQLIGTIEKGEQQGSWIQFFLLFTMPFTSSAQEVAQSVFYDIHRATIDEAHGKGYF